MAVYGSDQYNQNVYEELSPTLGTNCNMPSGRNGIIEPAYGVVTKGNGDAFINPNTHSSLTKGGGEAGQGYPCVLEVTDEKIK